MDENCVFCLIMSIVLIIAGVFCLICMYKLVDFEDWFIKLRRNRVLKSLSRLGFSSSEAIELYEFFIVSSRLTITNKELKTLIQRLKNQKDFSEDI